MPLFVVGAVAAGGFIGGVIGNAINQMDDMCADDFFGALGNVDWRQALNSGVEWGILTGSMAASVYTAGLGGEALDFGIGVFIDMAVHDASLGDALLGNAMGSVFGFGLQGTAGIMATVTRTGGGLLRRGGKALAGYQPGQPCYQHAANNVPFSRQAPCNHIIYCMALLQTACHNMMPISARPHIVGAHHDAPATITHLTMSLSADAPIVGVHPVAM